MGERNSQSSSGVRAKDQIPLLDGAQGVGGNCPRDGGQDVVAPNTDGFSDPPRLALRPKQAAKAIGICERLLWSETNAGRIPHLRIGRSVVYPVRELQEWLGEQSQKKGGRP